jgi:hypothetical protein
MVTVNWRSELVVTGGPSKLADDHFEAEAYDVNQFVVAAEGSALVDIQPGDPGDVLAIMITSDNYEDLTYTVDQGSPNTLDGPLTLIGVGQVALLGATCNVFAFVNSGTVLDANVQIIVVRNAVDSGM